MSTVKEAMAEASAAIARHTEEQRTLRGLDCFVLDNSLRESTAGALSGHTLENKWNIYEQVKRCGFKHIIVAAFSNMTRVDDRFVRQLAERGEDMNTLYSFSEGWGRVKDGLPDVETLPVALNKMKTLKMKNPIIEVDLADSRIDWGKFTEYSVKDLLVKRLEWVRKNLGHDAKVLVNFRDFSSAMQQPESTRRVLSVTEFLARLPTETRPLGPLIEDAIGKSFPSELSAWTRAVRRVMNSCDWSSGKLLVHVHEKWGLVDAAQLACLGSGADGIWASLCSEGIALGHACSSVTLMNLVRLGNNKVLERYNCTELRRAAIKVTEITRGRIPHPKQPVYGERALDVALEVDRISGKHVGDTDFNLASFFGETTLKRMNTIASPDIVLARLKSLFGDQDSFTLAIAMEMKTLMKEDLCKGRKEEYMSEFSLALLFDRAGGSLTESMRDMIDKVKSRKAIHERLLREVKEIWDTWDTKEAAELQGGDYLEFDSFYNGIMAPYFGCVYNIYACDDTRKGLRAIDMDSEGRVY